MAPWPNESSLYDACTPVSGQLVSWKDDPSPAVFETKPHDTTTSTKSTNEDEGAGQCGCKKGAIKVARLLKESWRNPRYFRWFMTIATSVVFAVILGFMNAFGPLYMCFRKDLHSTAVETGWVASLAWSFGITSPFVNTLYQRMGPRKIAILAALFCSMGVFSSTFVTSIWPLFITFGLILGFGVNLMITGSMSVVASHFDSNDCALPTTLPGVGGAIGTLIYCPVLELAYEHFGWRTTLRFVASLMFVTGLSGAMLYKRPASQKGTTNATPSATEDSSSKALLDSDTPSTSAASVTTVEAQKIKSLQIKQDKEQLKRERHQRSKENYIHLVKNLIHWMFCVATMLSNVVMIFNVINLVELMDSVGYSPQRSAMFMSILSFVETSFRLVTGIFGDRLPCARTLLFPLMCIISACTTFSLTMSSCTAVIAIYVCVAGMGRAVNYSIVFSASIETFGHAVHQESFSMILVSYGVACLLAAVIPGLSFDLTGSYIPANYCGAVMWLIAAALYLAVYFFTNRKNRLRMPYTSVNQLPASDKGAMCKVETCSPLTVAHALTEKGVDLEGALGALDADSMMVATYEHVIIVDRVSTV